jgi:hypothetical protein
MSIDADFVDVIHFIDHAPAICENAEYVLVDGVDEVILSVLESAIAASDREGYVATEVYSKVAVESGVIKICTNSFSVYKWENNKFNEIAS